MIDFNVKPNSLTGKINTSQNWIQSPNDANNQPAKLPQLNGLITQMDKSNPLLGNANSNSIDAENSKKSGVFNGSLTQTSVKIDGKILKKKDNFKTSSELIKSSMEAKSPSRTGPIEYGYYYSGVVKYYRSNEKDYFANLYKDHFKHTYISLQFCKNLKPPSKKDLILKRCT